MTMQSPVVSIDAVKSVGTKLPPYGREVEEVLVRRLPANVYAYADAEAWTRAGYRRAALGKGTALVLPLHEMPEQYRWPAVRNGMLIAGEGQNRKRVFGLARAIVSCGTPLVFAIYGNNEALVVRTINMPNVVRQS